ncbi:shufflon system plasmid conjugative transfer pilus tip adhesin PilV [Erwinia psidii]|uniref:Shufflon system plasmid conjugative transfer pilus tip adhesin PilV n=1 Tax=Erwinia psidii TaxID=69224 RepID=A0A3N6UPM6_9GAMM|nr:shufflon system plasmid conjugative transfer pilus tip adhesin PilV [Erwinia psidii]MCX8957035.1 shufflon system plasmid conjugative transfer pilus tip adhesin PilV [Erwinia psidii]MCX8965293.1 shufflon system plasmid conjugative transfer pilus tip adhesin PilV [Erwinia psidii]RQM37909.1 shufflon system plasmid conjugative transfer pilus tip adhesin PilV [Erwinia psidii]
MVTSVLKQPHTDRGWAILSTGAALIILLLVSVWGYSQVGDWLTRRAWMATAAQTSRFTQAVKSYTGRYYDTLLAGAPVSVTPAMLKNTGFLEQGFSETTTDGQGYQAVLIRNSTNTDQLQGMVYTQGGTALPFLALRQISMDITSGMGGYIWTAGVATGAAGGWSVPLSGFGVSTTQGHIAALLTADELGVARGESDRLYRFSVTGKPDLNTMHTSIDMGGNNLNNTGTVNAVTGTFSGSVTAGGNMSANATVSGQNVTAGTDVTAGNAMTANNDIRSNNGWFVTRDGKGWLNETYGGGFYMSDNDWVRTVNNKSIYTAGQIKGGSLRADGRLSTGEVLQLDGINTAGAVCSPNGLVSRDASGLVMSCLNGVWQGSPANGQYSGLGGFTGQYNGFNNTAHTITIYATGGVSTVNKGISSGNCSNTWALAGYAGGVGVVNAADSNVEWAKQGAISFQVPGNTAYTVISSPNPSYGCSPGSFTLYSYN